MSHTHTPRSSPAITYTPATTARPSRARDAVLELLRDRRWHTLAELRAICASADARLRDLRKPEFGGHLIESEPIPGERSAYRYRLV